jgi:outer membrane protein assembly factor BamB
MKASTRLAFFLFVTCLWLCASYLPADSWLQFRGPDGNGAIQPRMLPLDWSDSKNVKWFAKLPGLGWSSPVVVNDRIYVTSAVAQGDDDKNLEGPQVLRLIALNLETGHEIFSREIFQQTDDAPKVHNKNSHASPTPLYDGERLLVHFGHQGTAAVDLDGKTLWENREHAFPPTHGNGGSPIIVDDKFIVTCDGGDEPYTLALDRTTGREVWRALRQVEVDRKFSFSTPSSIAIDGRSQIISAGSNVVQSIDPKTGKVLWFVNYDGYSVIPKPILHHGLVFVCTGYGPTALYAIDPTGTGDVTASHVRWKLKSQNVPKTPSLIAYENSIIMCGDKGVATGIEVATGKEIWKQRLGGDYSASPLLNGKQIYFQSEQGEAIVMELSQDGTEPPKEVSRSMLPGRTFASYAVIGNDLLIRAEAGLYRIGSDK